MKGADGAPKSSWKVPSKTPLKTPRIGVQSALYVIIRIHYSIIITINLGRLGWIVEGVI